MARTQNAPNGAGIRLKVEDVVRVGKFQPVWVSCTKCGELAYMREKWPEGMGQCKCLVCGAIYGIALAGHEAALYPQLPLWLKANFKGHIFWALNGEHLDYLERIIQTKLRERPVIQFPAKRARFIASQSMPFNLPGWILSAKNRPDLLRMINRLRKTIPLSESLRNSR